MKTYPSLRTVHLLAGALAVPMLVMYGLSALQMAHSRWFPMKPQVTQFEVALTPGHADGRAAGLEFMRRAGVAAEIQEVRATPTGYAVRITVPGTVHEVAYDAATGRTRVKRSVAGFWGMLNRLHHAAGLWHSYAPLQLWGALTALVSLATVVLGATGLWMWWLRREERALGAVLLVANLVFGIVVLVWLRTYGP